MMRRALGLTLFVVVLILLLGLEWISASGKKTPDGTDHPRPVLTAPDDFPERAAGFSRSEKASAGVNSVNAPPTWSRLVFQSLRDRNWEVYTADSDGGNQKRLTHHGATDVYPRLNRGGTQIAFASTRTGNYEIFVMNVDGSDLRQLTYLGSNEYSPAWSPDGSQIAFSSYRDGQSEVYVINVDGSGLKRLTVHGEYDGQPAWSPDGTKIAFTSWRSGGYRIWVMQADGSGKQQLSSHAISENATWSPDGQQIAYDADGDSNGWQEIWVMSADGSNQRQLYTNTGYQTDAVARSWSADGRYVGYTQISWIYYQGQWYWTEAYLEAVDALSWGNTRLSNVGTDWYPDWQTTDTLPPQSAIRPLPPYWRTQIRIMWNGADQGGAGLDTYDIQYRKGTQASWTGWLTQTTLTTAFFDPSPGETYYFRSRAIDGAFNTEPWPSGNGDSQSTIYAWALSGRVADSRGTPVEGTNFTLVPSAFELQDQTGGGEFAAYFAQTVTHTLGWSKQGYGSLPITLMGNTELDAQIDVVLPPADNVVTDPGFEASTLTGGGWLPGGVAMPTVTGTLKHTGDQSVLLGRELGFDQAMQITNSMEWSGDSKIAVDDLGLPHVVWTEGSIPQREILYSRRDVNGVWSTPKNISNTPATSTGPSVVVDEKGVVHAVWYEGSGGGGFITHSQDNGNGTWSAPITLGLGSNVQIGLDRSGVLHAMWSDDSDIYYSKLLQNGSWAAPELIASMFTGFRRRKMAVEDGGTVHALWAESRSLLYSTLAPGGSWTNPVNISSIPNAGIDSPLIALDDFGGLYAVWIEYASGGSVIHYAQRDSNGNWTNFGKLPGSLPGSTLRQIAYGQGNLYVFWNDGQHGQRSYARLDPDGRWSGPISTNFDVYQAAVDESGDVHIVWGGTDAYYARLSADGRWTSIQNLSGTGLSYTTVDLAVVKDGAAHVVWYHAGVFVGGWNEVHYAGPRTASTTGYSRVSQVVAIPAGMSNPTLSFQYQLRRVEANSGSWFEVNVQDNIGATTILSETGASDWQHYWHDMGPWAGQTVTVTFTLYQTAGNIQPRAHVDEVTIGSAHPDLWIDVEGTPNALAGETAVFQISYGNRSSVAAAVGLLTATLPAELSFYDADLSPVSTAPLVWDVGGIAGDSGPFTITLTTTISSAAPPFVTLQVPFQVDATSAELETHNNQSISDLFVGKVAYLPTIKRD